MGKKKKAGKKPTEPKLSKKALKKREAELEREIDRREKKAAKKALAASDAMLAAEAKKAAKKADKKGDKTAKAPKVTDADRLPEPVGVITASAEAPIVAESEPETPVDLPSRAAIVEAAEKVVAGNSSDAARESAQDALDAVKEAPAEETDAQIRERVRAKREARDRDARLREMQQNVADRHGYPGPNEVEAARAARDADVVEKVGVAVDALRQATEAVETETGTIYATGESVAAEPVADFAKPSEAPQDDFAVNGNGQYLVSRPSDGKLVGYTRVTTYISCLEDTTKLTDWKMRLLLEGVAVADGDPETREPVTARIRDLAHVRDVAIAKARKADKKGKLEVGQLGVIVDGAWRDFKRAMDALADELFEIGGGREKAAKGTDIHELCALAVEHGIEVVGDKLTAGEISPQDLVDVEAFLAALKKLDAKVLEVERVIVHDDLKVAGRLDYVVMVKLPGEARARRRVLDLKTGRVDYSTGKIAQQLEMYASATGYDLDTHEREDLKLDRTKALLVHLAAGTGEAHVYVADLSLGRKGNRLAGDVRAWRNEGKRAIDLKSDVLAQI